MPEKHTTLEDIADFLEDNDDYCIYFHKNPDGDAIGSAFGLALALKAAKKRVCLKCDSKIPSNYHFLTDKFGGDRVASPVNICVDSASPSRLGEYSEEKITVCIDHHNDNTVSARYKYVDPSACACAEIVYELIRIMGVPISPLMADFLYVGVCTDSMCFRSRTVRANTLRTAYELCMCHADVVNIARKFFLTRSERCIRVESRLKNSFTLYHNNKVLGSKLTNDDYTELDIQPEDTEGLNDLVETVEGVKIGIVVRECKKGKCRISVRSMCNIGADAICAEFGGGGHHNAAGAIVEGSADDILEQVVEKAGKFLTDYEKL